MQTARRPALTRRRLRRHGHRHGAGRPGPGPRGGLPGAHHAAIQGQTFAHLEDARGAQIAAQIRQRPDILGAQLHP
eukprot:7583114-Pyramimonas_sp.AAC.1